MSTKNLFAAFMTLSLLVAPMAYAKGFSDVPQEHQNFVAINYLSDQKVLKGYADGTFQPAKKVNRAEALKVILEQASKKLLEKLPENIFSDVPASEWFGVYVATAKSLGIVNGNPDGTFTPSSTVKRAAFLKMLLETHGFKKEKWSDQQLFADVSKDAWYAPYMNYAGKSGLLTPDGKRNVFPDRELSRAEVAEILYLMRIILRGKDTQFLLTQSEAQMAQIEIYIANKNVPSANRASELAVDMTQQALQSLPDNNIVIAAAKLAKAYQLVVNAYIAGLQKKTKEARDLANQAKTKATEAWEANHDIQTIAKHIKDRADEILKQL